MKMVITAGTVLVTLTGVLCMAPLRAMSEVPSLSCSLNGVFSQDNATCTCRAGWQGPACAEMAFRRSSAEVAVPHVLNSTARPWTWGGSVVYDPVTSQHHMFFSEITHGCGLLHYQTNSIVRHAVSDTGVTGPWRVLPTPALTPSSNTSAWDSSAIHGPEVQYDPSTKTWLLFYMGTQRREGIAQPDCVARPDSPIVDLSPSRRIGLAWSKSIAEDKVRWHRLPGPILSPRQKPNWDWTDVSNAAPLVFPNGSVLLGYRGGGDGVALGGGIGLAFASHWNASSGFTRRIGYDSMLFAAEDGHMWLQQEDGGSTVSYHMLVHRFASGNGSTAGTLVGGHAYSIDGWNWHFDPTAWAYTTSVEWTNKTDAVLYRRERPKLLQEQNASARSRQWLFSGAWPCHFGAEDVDWLDTERGCQSVTMVEELNTYD